MDDENGEEQVSGVVAIVEIGEKEAEKNEVQTFDADARFDEKNLVDETNRVGWKQTQNELREENVLVFKFYIELMEWDGL